MRTPNRSDAMTNRRFGTTDLAIVLGLWSAMAVLLGGVISELASDAETPMAKAQTEAYALQLASSEAATQENQIQGASASGGRAPASVLPADRGLRSGSLGKDPWGNPYRYRIVANGVIVWSAGRDRELDSEPAINRLEMGQPISEFRFAGDDVGFVKLRHNSN